MATSCIAHDEKSAAPVHCPEMNRLREEAKHLHEQLRLSRQSARQHEQADRRSDGRGNHSNDYESFLQRKLLKNAMRISCHIVDHKCAELGVSR
jgi:hypothetical protein